MSCSKLKLICFSPTRTTRKVLDAIAEGIEADSVEVIDVSRLESIPDTYECADDDLVIIGVPVYYGRVPVPAVKRFATLKGSGGAVVPVVVYGNRDYDDALIELTDMTVRIGFTPIAAAAFIGEHSFSGPDTPIAANRPDEDDLAKARKFGRDLAERLNSIDLENAPSLDIPGNKPYKPLLNRPAAAPISVGECQLCGSCEKVCPADAIQVGTRVETDAMKCILCCACVKICAFNARKMKLERIIQAANTLSIDCAERKEPELFT
ncbi:4Fe-4S binding protein [Maridesulfovibrio hydrothermalis]|uniref:4Fe-4S ferredoxin iron-sulfur binding domain protein n=1 Tax=Maridesulfovibrio hydrothermalis AM13 = DSM 14728 TaxID=1121451 RepID=L0RAA9_9BACT|nr:4Fe-4S binding protein [Maridesulfovibrio hydrothermalis]CCO23694.1 4Fe-4S ferredoxin iron-sulfur binding domain protein [Maridesulfovibrio hydrothermalis AM13 = DSM 14728]